MPDGHAGPNAVIPQARVMKHIGTGWNCLIRLSHGGGGRVAQLLVGSPSHSGKWRTLADEATAEQTQASLDRFSRRSHATRLRATSGGRFSVAVVAKTEPRGPCRQCRIR